MQLFYCPGQKEVLTVADLPFTAPGGEGAVHLVPSHPGIVAKLFKEPLADDRRARVENLIAHPPRGHGRWRFAAPLDTLEERATGKFVGYTMPLVSNAAALDEFFDAGGTRFRRELSFRVGLAIAVAEAVAELHRHALDLTIADLKPANILADDRGNVTLIDIDSVQMTTVRGTTYLSSARSEFYTAPEVYGMDLRRQRRDQTADLFSLAVIIFQLLMCGWHPSACTGGADLVGQIKRGVFAYVVGSPDRPPPGAPALPGELRHISAQAFVDGHSDPGKRPTADDWVNFLKQNEKALTRRPQVLPAPRPLRRAKRRVVVAAVAAAVLAAAVPGLLPAWRLARAGVATLAGPATAAPDVQAAAAYALPFAPNDDWRVPRWDSRRRTATPAYWRRLRDGGGAPLSFETSADTGRQP